MPKNHNIVLNNYCYDRLKNGTLSSLVIQWNQIIKTTVNVVGEICPKRTFLVSFELGSEAYSVPINLNILSFNHRFKITFGKNI